MNILEDLNDQQLKSLALQFGKKESQIITILSKKKNVDPKKIFIKKKKEKKSK